MTLFIYLFFLIFFVCVGVSVVGVGDPRYAEGEEGEGPKGQGREAGQGQRRVQSTHARRAGDWRSDSPIRRVYPVGRIRGGNGGSSQGLCAPDGQS